MKVIYDSYLRRHRNGINSTTANNNNNNGNNVEICHPASLTKNTAANMNSECLAPSSFTYIISCDSLVINKQLGVGEFGVVQQGVWTNSEGRRIQVAIKCLSSARMENNRQEFLKEADIMQSISNEHIVTIYGVVLEPSVMLVTELAPLRSLLECLKEAALISHFPVTSLCTFAAQIANGMAYLESKRLIHRDLAARNILVFSKNKVKISDFGLSRALGVGKDYYQSNFNVNLKLPIAWCAPECINYLKFTSQSDVWAYGVTLWEMFSFGFQPWAALTGQQILEAIDSPNLQRLEQPECCPKEYYQLMLKCWIHEPNLRPKFSDIVNILPDCKPELLQAIRNSSTSNRKEFLPYRTGDIVTVIDKLLTDCTDPAFESCWKGANNERKTGYFTPNDFVAYLGLNLPSSSSSSCPTATSTSSSFVQHFLSGNSSNGNSNGHHSNSHTSLASTITSTVLQSSKFLRGFLESKTQHSSSSSPHGTRKCRLRPEMISKPQEGKYHHLPKNHSNNGSLDGNESKSSSKKVPMISRPIASFAPLKNGKVSDYCEENHEYHEISDEDDLGPLESPPFEAFDLGPSLMEEVFRELDHIKPDLNNETAKSETAINENGINVKNEVQELNLRICKETNNFRKKQSHVKPISEAELNELDSAIAMAKDIANRTMLEDELDLTKSDSPKTPNSPNKRKFSFKFPTHKSPKGERRTFSEETESIGDIIESITPAAKEAYLSLVEKGVANVAAPKKDGFDKRPDVKPPPPPPATSGPPLAAFNLPSPTSSVSNSMSDLDNNPLRMLRTAGIGKVLRPKVRGNRSFSQPRLPTTAQTAGLARVASSRSQLGSPPPVPGLEDGHSLQQVQSQPTYQSTVSAVNNANALPLPPRDRTRPCIQLKTHQRRHPLVIPTQLIQDNDHANGHSLVSGEDLPYDSAKHDSPPIVHRHVPVLKQVSCPQAPAAFLNVYNKTNNDINSPTNHNLTECDKAIPLPPPKPNRTYLTDDLTESLESEMQKAFESIKLNQNSKDNLDNNYEESVETDNSSSISPPVEKLANQKVSPLPIISNTQSQINSNGGAEPSPNQTTQSARPTTERDEVRVMQKVLGNEANLSDEECALLLDTTDWDIHKAIKCIRLRQQLRSHNIQVECNWAEMLTKFRWNIRQAFNYLIATQGVQDTTEV